MAAIITATLFRDASKVKNLRKKTTISAAEEELMDAAVTDELVADHEWESLLHTFEPEAGELHVGGEEESDDLWERLSSTRWLKSSAPVYGSSAESDADSSSETAANEAQA